MARSTAAKRLELESFWRSHLEDWRRSDLNQREYCELHGLPLKRFGNWRAKFNRHFPDNLQIRSDHTHIAPPFERFSSAGIRRPDLGDLAEFGSQFGQFCRHPHTPLPSFLPRSEVSRPTPERVFVVDHRSGSGFSETVPSARQLRPVGR